MSRRRPRPHKAPRGPATRDLQPPTTYPYRLDVIAAIVLTLVAGVLVAAFVVHAPSLWRDEISSVHTQQAPTFAEMWRRAEFESFPALWMFLLRAWLAIGGGASDATLRIFGLIGPIALIAGLWFASVRIGRIAPVLSLALVVINPEVLRWSVTLRPWGLGAGLMLVATALLWDAMRRPDRRTLIGAALACVLSVHCLFQNAVFLAAIAAGCGVVALRRGRGQLLAVPLAIGAMCAVSLTPYLGMIQRRSDWNPLGMGPATLGELAAIFGAVLAAPGTFAWLVMLGLMAATLLLAALAWRHGGSEEIGRHDDVIVAGVTTVTAVVGLMLFYRWLSYPTQPWYYLGLIALVAMCGEVTVRSQLPARLTTPLVGLTVAALLATGTVAAWGAMCERQTNVDVIATRLEAEAGPQDVVIVNPWFIGVTLSRYYGGRSRVMTIPPIADHTISRYDLLKQQMLESDATAPVRQAIDDALKTGHRVWVVGGLLVPPPGVTIPSSLPPPPLPDTGWNSMPYELLWSKQVGSWLHSRSSACRNVDPGVRGGQLEDVHLIVCDGWRNIAMAEK